MTANALVVAILGFGLPPNPLLDACPLFGRGSSSSSTATSSNKRPSVTSLLDDAEKQFLASAGPPSLTTAKRPRLRSTRQSARPSMSSARLAST